MPLLYDYECQSCHKVFEVFTDWNDGSEHDCPECQGGSRRIVSIGGSNVFREEAPWLRSVLEVVAKDSDKQHTREFLNNPTRANYKRWLKGEGIRPFEPGEKPTRPSESEAIRRHTDRIMRMRQERNAITL